MGFELKNTQLEANGEFVSFSGTDDVICEIASGSYDSDDKLAMLFAAAPELLEALIELTESAKEAIDGLGDLSDAIDTAKVAIAKATGTKG